MTEGQYLAIVDGRAFATADDLWTVARRPPRSASRTRGSSLVHVLRSEDAPEEGELAARIDAHGLEAAVLWGGQPHYPLLLSAE